MGIIYNGLASNSVEVTDEQWADSAEEHFKEVESKLGITPYAAQFTTWSRNPLWMLPETKRGTLTNVVKRYVDWKQSAVVIEPPFVSLEAEETTLEVPASVQVSVKEDDTVAPAPVPTPAAAVTVSTRLPIGYLDGVSCKTLNGWSYDLDSMETPVTIHIYEGNTFVAGGKADKVREDVNRVMKVTGNYGFYIPTPSSLKDGKDHVLRAYAIDVGGSVNPELTLSPRTLNCASSTNASLWTSTMLLASIAAAPLMFVVEVLSNLFVSFGI